MNNIALISKPNLDSNITPTSNKNQDNNSKSLSYGRNRLNYYKDKKDNPNSWINRIARNLKRVLTDRSATTGRLVKKFYDWLYYSPNDTCNKIVNYFFAMQATQGSVYPSYRHIARKFGCSTKTVQRVVNELCEMGILKKEWRYKKSNIYTFHDIVFDEGFRSRFSNYYSSLKIALTGAAFLMSLFSGNVRANISDRQGVLQAKLTRRDINEDEEYIISKPLVCTNRNRKISVFPNRNNLRDEMLHAYTRDLKTRKWKITLAGRVRLQPFPAQIIKIVWESRLWTERLYPEWAHLIRLLKEECTTQCIRPDWAMEARLLEMYNLRGDVAYVEFFQDRPYAEYDDEQNPYVSKRALMTTYDWNRVDHCLSCRSALHVTKDCNKKALSYKERQITFPQLSKNHNNLFTSLKETVEERISTSIVEPRIVKTQHMDMFDTMSKAIFGNRQTNTSEIRKDIVSQKGEIEGFK